MKEAFSFFVGFSTGVDVVGGTPWTNRLHLCKITLFFSEFKQMSVRITNLEVRMSKVEDRLDRLEEKVDAIFKFLIDKFGK